MDPGTVILSAALSESSGSTNQNVGRSAPATGTAVPQSIVRERQTTGRGNDVKSCPVTRT